MNIPHKVAIVAPYSNQLNEVAQPAAAQSTRVIAITDLAGLSVVAFAAAVDHIELRKIGAQPSIACEIIDKSTLLQFVAHGLGIILIPAWVQNIAPPGVTFVPFKPCDYQIDL